MSITGTNSNIGRPDTVKSRDATPWKRATPTSRRLNCMTCKVEEYQPKPEPLFTRAVAWLKSLETIEKPFHLARQGVEIAEKMSFKGAEHFLEIFSPFSKLFAIASVIHTLATAEEEVEAEPDYIELFKSSCEMVVVVLNVALYLLCSQLIKTILKPLSIGVDLMKGGFALKNHYDSYTEGKDAWQITGLRLGETFSSIGLSLVAIAALSAEMTVVLPTLVIALSLVHLGSQVSLYFLS